MQPFLSPVHCTGSIYTFHQVRCNPTTDESVPCCGAEHHSDILENDTRWKDGYFKSNKPKSTNGKDICRTVYNQKKKYLSGKNLTFIAPSNWEHDVLKSSDLFRHNKCHVVPNILPESEFYKKDKAAIREFFGIPEDKIVIGFGAAGQLDDPKSMKGTYYIIEFLKKIKNPEKYFLLIIGPADSNFTKYLNLPFFLSGFVSNTSILSCLYNACDLTVNPSLIENLPTMCLESVFCSVPVVAFDVGGTSDIVKHKINGYLAKPFEVDDMVCGIEYCIENHKSLVANCETVKLDFDEEDVIKNYIKVYKTAILQGNCQC